MVMSYPGRRKKISNKQVKVPRNLRVRQATLWGAWDLCHPIRPLMD
jgi:hypothetical protein